EARQLFLAMPPRTRLRAGGGTAPLLREREHVAENGLRRREGAGSLSVEHHRSRSLAAQVDPVELVAHRSEEVALRNERGMDPHVEPARRAQRDSEELRHVAEALGLAEVLELHAH